MFKKLLSIAVMLMSTGACHAADNFPKTFDATYDVTSPAGNSVVRMASDGKGKMLTESNTASYKVTTINDYLKKESYSLLHDQKMLTVTKFNTEDAGCDEATMKKRQAKFLGEKTIAGRKCKGWSYSFPGGSSEVWSDNRDVLITSTTTAANGKTVMTVKSIKDQAPDDTAFAIPANYKKLGN